MPMSAKEIRIPMAPNSRNPPEKKMLKAPVGGIAISTASFQLVFGQRQTIKAAHHKAK
jgi:hypothetical protein